MKVFPSSAFEIASSPMFEQDLDTQERIIEDKMLKSYVAVLFIASLLLCAVVLF